MTCTNYACTVCTVQHVPYLALLLCMAIIKVSYFSLLLLLFFMRTPQEDWERTLPSLVASSFYCFTLFDVSFSLSGAGAGTGCWRGSTCVPTGDDGLVYEQTAKCCQHFEIYLFNILINTHTDICSACACMCVCVCACVIKLNTELPSVLSQKHSLATFTAPVATSILSDEFLCCVFSVWVYFLFFFLLLFSSHRVLFYVRLQAKLSSFFFFIFCSITQLNQKRRSTFSFLMKTLAIVA